MPLYEYECDDCGHRFERQQKFSDPPVTNCTECDGSVHKVFYPASVIFKGSGWYVTDNRSSNGKGKENGSSKPKEAPAKDSAESKAAGTAKTESGGDSKSSKSNESSSSREK
jgi:putative FmdB family regulatory protein